MSDIQEEQKRLYKRAEENDIKLLQDRINKAIEYIEQNKHKLYQGRNEFTCEIQYSEEIINAKDLLNILQGSDRE